MGLDNIRSIASLAGKSRLQVVDLVPRLSSLALALANRIKHLGWQALLEDQLATLATYEWQLRTSERISEETARRYAVQS